MFLSLPPPDDDVFWQTFHDFLKILINIESYKRRAWSGNCIIRSNIFREDVVGDNMRVFAQRRRSLDNPLDINSALQVDFSIRKSLRQANARRNAWFIGWHRVDSLESHFGLHKVSSLSQHFVVCIESRSENCQEHEEFLYYFNKFLASIPSRGPQLKSSLKRWSYWLF